MLTIRRFWIVAVMCLLPLPVFADGWGRGHEGGWERHERWEHRDGGRGWDRGGWGRVGFGITIGPSYPTYCAPPPVIYSAPVVVQPAPTYYAPATNYAPGAVYTAPAPTVVYTAPPPVVYYQQAPTVVYTAPPPTYYQPAVGFSLRLGFRVH